MSGVRLTPLRLQPQVGLLYQPDKGDEVIDEYRALVE
jgi:hypothetical protein